MNIRKGHRRPRRSSNGPVRALSLALGLALAIALVPSLLAPLFDSPMGASGASAAAMAAGPAALQDDGSADETPVTEETPVTDETPVIEETPVVEETPIVEETATVDETPVVEQTPDQALAGGYTARIVVFMMGCSSDYGHDFQQLSANCGAPPANISFDVYGVDNYGGGVQQSGTKYLDISGIYGGQYTIRENIPQGYRSPLVFCSRGTGPNPQGPYSEVVTYDGYYEFSLVDTERIACYWFNIPIVTGYGSLTLGFSICPPVESIPFPFDYATADAGDLAGLCSIYRDSAVPFLLYSHANGQNQNASTNPGNDGIAYWAQVPAGQQSLSTEPWSGYGSPRVFCYDTGNTASIYEASVQGWQAVLEVKVGEATVCDWFNIPAPAPVPQNSSTVAVLAHFCDDIIDSGTDPATATRDELLALCPSYTGTEVGFDLFMESTGESVTRFTGATGDGAALWESVPAGNLTVTEIAGVDGYSQSVVFCSPYDPRALVLDSVFEPVQVQSGSFGFQLFENYSLYCDWFNIPAPENGNGTNGEGTGVVSVFSSKCPDTAMNLGSFAAYAKACTDTIAGATFKLDGASSGNPGEKTTGANGSAAWPGREADHYYLYAQELPAGGAGLAVYCDTYTLLGNHTPDYAAYAVSDEGRIEFDLEEGESIDCRWFVLSQAQSSDQQIEEENQNDGDSAPVSTGETGSITIYEWLCPAGFDIAADGASPWLQCAVASDGVELSITGPAGFADAQTAGEAFPGAVHWNGLGGGDYLIDDTQPNDAATGVVLACHGLATPTAYPLYSTESGSSMVISLEEGQQVACFWFIVPAEDQLVATGGNGTLAATRD